MRFIVETFPIFSISNDLLQLLTSWKKQQKYELAKFGIISNPEQFIFTYIDTKGNINKPLHSDYLNNKMKTIRKSSPQSLPYFHLIVLETVRQIHRRP
ncbi:phage integrase family integrase/recombinase [Streptococcus pneumoniae]|nr:phage integrase family integrase/recombinase [Streptococcus pneumoniae]CIW11066.1 phage integrase family integrase/recombinase [Streptococcus pneumoniae]